MTNEAPKHTPGPWDYIASTEHHGPYVSGPFGGDIADCYTMSNLRGLSVRNGGDSKPILFQGDEADANALLIAAAPDLLLAAKAAVILCGSVAASKAAIIELLSPAIAKATNKPEPPTRSVPIKERTRTTSA